MSSRQSKEMKMHVLQKMKKLIPMQTRRACLAALLAGLLSACAPRLLQPTQEAQIPADFPGAYYTQAAAHGKKVLRVDAGKSLVVLEVRRAGAFARLGHDHVVASHDVQGFVMPDEGRSDLYVALDRLVVDEPGLRAEAGFAPQPPADAIEGTRRNMLDKVLESARFPFALIRITRSDDRSPTLNVSIVLHGATRVFEVPAQFETVPGGLAISGKMHFNQSDFGIVPFSVLGGAIQVQDRLDLQFRILAKTPAAPSKS
jgi:hypothetical protein